jgi:uncharacterized protein YjaG (DUF416 family)
MDKFREEARNALESVSFKGKVLFAVLTCEKLYPNYVFFKKMTNWGSPDILLRGIGFAYKYLVENEVDVKNLKKVILDVDNITPNTEDFPGIFVSFALDACTSVYSCLSFLLDNNIDNIVDIAVYARDTVDMFIQERDNLNSSDPTIEVKIANDHLMIREKTRQIKLITNLRTLNFDTLTDGVIESLRDSDPIIDLEALPFG